MISRSHRGWGGPWRPERPLGPGRPRTPEDPARQAQADPTSTADHRTLADQHGRADHAEARCLAHARAPLTRIAEVWRGRRTANHGGGAGPSIGADVRSRDSYWVTTSSNTERIAATVFSRVHTRANPQSVSNTGNRRHRKKMLSSHVDRCDTAAIRAIHKLRVSSTNVL